MSTISSGCCLAGTAILATFRQRWGEAVKYGIAWTLILLALVAGYSMRDDLKRAGYGMLASLVPGLAVEVEPGVVALRMADDGHFYAHAEVDGTTIRMLVDTGASLIALSAEDAQRIGFEPASLDYTLPISTANGSGFAAPVRLREVRVGTIILRDVRAGVLQPGMVDGSLLGMTFLGRLRGFGFEGDQLVLRR